MREERGDFNDLEEMPAERTFESLIAEAEVNERFAMRLEKHNGPTSFTTEILRHAAHLRQQAKELGGN